MYKLMCDMLKSITKHGFNEAYQRLQIIYANHAGILQYEENDGQETIVHRKKYNPSGVEYFDIDIQIQPTL